MKFQNKRHENQGDRGREEGEGGGEREEEEEGGGEFNTGVHEERELRKQLSEVEGAIAGLIADLRFECETELLAAAH